MKALITLSVFVVLIPLAGISIASAHPNWAPVLGGGGLITPSCIGSGGTGILVQDLLPGSSVTNAVAWQYDGTIPPYYGAFAEQYSAIGTVTGIQLDLTQDPNNLNYTTGAFDAIMWSDNDGMPGPVLAFVWNLTPGSPPALWPSVTCVNLPFPYGNSVNGFFWIGFWTDNTNSPAQWYVAEDTVNPGVSMTNIAPGIGYPTGWNSVTMVWPQPNSGERGTKAGNPPASLGIGAWVNENPTPAKSTSWGAIKSLYR